MAARAPQSDCFVRWVDASLTPPTLQSPTTTPHPPLPQHPPPPQRLMGVIIWRPISPGNTYRHRFDVEKQGLTPEHLWRGGAASLTRWQPPPHIRGPPPPLLHIKAWHPSWSTGDGSHYNSQQKITAAASVPWKREKEKIKVSQTASHWYSNIDASVRCWFQVLEETWRSTNGRFDVLMYDCGALQTNKDAFHFTAAWHCSAQPQDEIWLFTAWVLYLNISF